MRRWLDLLAAAKAAMLVLERRYSRDEICPACESVWGEEHNEGCALARLQRAVEEVES